MRSVRKRSVAKFATVGLAVGAGAVLAATAFTYTQPGSASAGVTAVDNVDDGDVTINDMTLGELIHFEDDETTGTQDYVGVEGINSKVITFTNSAKDEAALISLDAITSDSVDEDLYAAIRVGIVDESRTEIFSGYLDDIAGAGIAFTLPADSSISFGVYAWTDQAFTTTVDEDPATKQASWDIDYGYEGDTYAPDSPPVTEPPAEDSCDDVPDELDPTGELEGGHDASAGDCEQPSQDGFRP